MFALFLDCFLYSYYSPTITIAIVLFLALTRYNYKDNFGAKKRPTLAAAIIGSAIAIERVSQKSNLVTIL